jgi:peptidoglycan/LPS O-acetylase OafA/YrhL
VFAILFAGVVYLTVFARRLDQAMFADLNSFEMNTFGYTWIDAFYACLLLIVVTVQNGPLARVMRFRLLCHFGIISFCIYLIHSAVKDCLQWWIVGQEPMGMNWTVTVLAFFTTWALAALSWKFFEKPIIGWGHQFLYGRAKN